MTPNPLGKNAAWFCHTALALTILAIASLGPPPARAQNVLISTGSTWSYLDDGSDQGSAWAEPAYDDSAWATGPAELGYGDGDEATVVSYGDHANDKHITTYFRHHFTVADPSVYGSLELNVLRDDGAVVYLNGIEVFRTNMPAGPIDYLTLSSTWIGGIEELTFYSTPVSPTLLSAGTNVLAVEVHQGDPVSSDLSFDLELLGDGGSGEVNVVRGPYLQRATPTSLVVRWRTDVASDSRVSYGDTPTHLTDFTDEVTLTTEHEVELSGLLPDTTYYYAVGTASEVLAGADASTFFVTPPPAGTAKPTRIWVIGDSGTANADARAVRDAYLAFAGGTYADLWLMLGDNAYEFGSDEDYQAAVFDTYPQILAQTVLWPTLGNHDGYSADSATQTGPYYDIFTLPAGGEAGGIPSGTEAYYSFDYGNIHFIVLESHETDRSVGGAMISWLAADVAATTADWVIAYWHHPPYSKGSHDSDAEWQLIEMRENALPVLEDAGVDLVLSGHSHSYERSFLLDSHYGDSSTLTGANILDGGDGRPAGDGAYSKATPGPAPHEGAVYAVAGSSGKVTGGELNHPAMFISLGLLGSMVLDIDGNTLNAVFLDDLGTVADSFTLIKGPGCTTDADCDDSDFCNGAETCNTGTGQCTAGTPPACDDGQYCNGVETCNEATDGCDPGTDPCTGDQTCNEATDVCEGGAVIWMSFRSSTTLPGVGTVGAEDVVSYDQATGTWALEFDGSDVGLSGLEISSLGVLPGGDLLLSFAAAGTVGRLPVDESDIVRFTPISMGANTAGSFSLYFEGSGLEGIGSLQVVE